ncbi:MAG: excinuclease ABC subunit A [Pseudomonadota bacterium]
MTHNRSVSILKFASAFCVVVGLMMVAGLMPPLRPVFEIFIDLAFLPIDGTQSLSSDSDLLLGAISGGLLAGLGAMAWQVTSHVYAENPNLGRRILSIGLLSWFVTDSAGSILAGAWFNVVLNSGFLALFMVPMWVATADSRTHTA